MSVTTTDNARITTIRHALEVSHDQPSDSEAVSAPPPNAQSPFAQAEAVNPPGWEDRWRRVPSYRPIRNQLDDQRNVYTNAVEQNFIRVMFGGVYMQSTLAQIWRATGGKLDDKAFNYKIGGEF
ncbi:hypothetical protein BAUCODRAFT_63267 [Baudoinia panamericana UAMH 10762]|uniref:Uncharacterized protein n=1 Tax=Baudoinia panamericana (strain UAMH 10762) TaxID=717646 RepID=M2MRT1_BAUPA|nr:uncharacterized protein BAUCODRAFT_63267 [Baudoinia panamericana UAMH 10762]EMC99526.1 hypothetical protein BAUCODRAFT_63267 [Baudoinia panamericana UAMH 10762]